METDSPAGLPPYAPTMFQLEAVRWSEMLDFYVNVVKFAPITIENEHGYAWLDAKTIIVSLKRSIQIVSPSRSNGSLQFEVPDIVASITALELAGCHFNRKELDLADHYQAAYFNDPDGNELAIYQLEAR